MNDSGSIIKRSLLFDWLDTIVFGSTFLLALVPGRESCCSRHDSWQLTNDETWKWRVRTLNKIMLWMISHDYFFFVSLWFDSWIRTRNIRILWSVTWFRARHPVPGTTIRNEVVTTPQEKNWNSPSRQKENSTWVSQYHCTWLTVPTG